MALSSQLLNCLSGTGRWLKVSFGIWRKKERKVCILTQCMGVLGEGDSIRHFTFSKLHIPLGRFQKVFGLDQDQVCAAIVSDVLCWIKHLLVSVPDQIAFQKAMPLIIGVWFHREICAPICLLNRSYRALPFSTTEHNLGVHTKSSQEWMLLY